MQGRKAEGGTRQAQATLVCPPAVLPCLPCCSRRLHARAGEDDARHAGARDAGAAAARCRAGGHRSAAARAARHRAGAQRAARGRVRRRRRRVRAAPKPRRRSRSRSPSSSRRSPPKSRRKPPTTLQTTPATAEGEVERGIRASLQRASADLNRVDYRALNARRAHAVRHRETVRAARPRTRSATKNLVFARNLAEKAATIAAQLAGR